ncbi:MAG: DUF6762 family protein [Lachnospirales bacterium]
MEETVIVVMLKNKETGFLEKEICTLDVEKYEDYIVNIFVMDNKLYIRLSTAKDVLDWEYSAIYDYYDTEVYKDVAECVEVDDDYNPVWEIITDFTGDISETEEKLKNILEIHNKELEDVFETIADKEGEYKDGE